MKFALLVCVSFLSIKGFADSIQCSGRKTLAFAEINLSRRYPVPSDLPSIACYAVEGDTEENASANAIRVCETKNPGETCSIGVVACLKDDGTPYLIYNGCAYLPSSR